MWYCWDLEAEVTNSVDDPKCGRVQFSPRARSSVERLGVCKQ